MSVFSATSECWNNASELELHGFIPKKNANQIETGGRWEDRLRQISLHHLADLTEKNASREWFHSVSRDLRVVPRENV